MSKRYEQWVLEVQQDGWTLEYVPELMIDDHICYEAVHQNGLALRYVPEEKKSYALCVMAVERDEAALEFVPDAYRDLIVTQLHLA